MRTVLPLLFLAGCSIDYGSMCEEAVSTEAQTECLAEVSQLARTEIGDDLVRETRRADERDIRRDLADRADLCRGDVDRIEDATRDRLIDEPDRIRRSDRLRDGLSDIGRTVDRCRDDLRDVRDDRTPDRPEVDRPSDAPADDRDADDGRDDEGTADGSDDGGDDGGDGTRDGGRDGGRAG